MTEAAAQTHLPEAPVSPGMPSDEMLSITGQAALLHAEIYGMQNGIPTPASYGAARQFKDSVYFDPDFTYTNAQGVEERGAYFARDGEPLPHDLTQDIIYAGSPDNWVQASSHRDVLGHARDVLSSNGAVSAIDASSLEMAEAVASRVAEDPRAIDAEALQRLLDLDTLARAELMRENGGREIIAAEAARSERMANEIVANTVATGSVSRFQVVGETPRAEKRLMRPDDVVLPAPENGPATSAAAVNVKYAEKQPDRDDPEILASLISDDTVRTPEDIALVLYPEKLVGGAQVYGAVRGKAYRSEPGVKNRLSSLTEAERAEVMGFARQVTTVRRLEADVPEQFKRHNELPTHKQLAAQLFPDVEKLTPRHWQVIGLARDRLQQLRLKHAHPDRFVGTYNQAVRGWRAVKAAAAAARETLKPESLRQRVGAKLGAAAVSAATFVQGKPWKRVLPALRDFAERIEPRDIALAISYKLQTMAGAAAGKLRDYLTERITAARNASGGEIAWQVGRATAIVGLASVLAVKAYLQYRHSVELPQASGGHHHSTLGELIDTRSGSNTAPDPNATEGLGKRPTNVNNIVEIGSFDGSKKILGYPKGTVGYRVLEHAQASGMDVHDKTQANRLIDATLKMDHLSWDEKVGAHQQIHLLSVQQMEDILKQPQ